MSNSELASLFEELANIMEIAGENIFKIRSYRTAAENIENHPIQLAEMTNSDIDSIPGVGKAIRDKIRNAIDTGSIPTLEKWRATGFATFMPLLSIKGVTARKLFVLLKEMQIFNFDEFKMTIESGDYGKLDKGNKKMIQLIESYFEKGQ